MARTASKPTQDEFGLAETANLPVPSEAKPEGGNGHPPGTGVRETFQGSPIKTIAQAISKITREVGPIAKEGRNAHFGYDFDRMEDLLEKLTPLIGENGLIIIPNEHSRSMVGDSYVMVTYEFTIAHTSGEIWPERPRWSGMSLLRSRREGFDDKALNKCSTQATKFFYKRLFNIATDTGDDERDDRRARRNPPTAQSALGLPRRLDPERGETAASWAEKYGKAFATAKNVEQMLAWDESNEDMLAKLQNANAKLYEEVYAKWEALRDKLGGRQATMMRSEPSVMAMPDPAGNPEDFLKWANAQCARIKSKELLEAFWNQRIDAHLSRLRFPSDADEALRIYASHERRLSDEDASTEAERTLGDTHDPAQASGLA